MALPTRVYWFPFAGGAVGPDKLTYLHRDGAAMAPAPATPPVPGKSSSKKAGKAKTASP